MYSTTARSRPRGSAPSRPRKGRLGATTCRIRWTARRLASTSCRAVDSLGLDPLTARKPHPGQTAIPQPPLAYDSACSASLNRTALGVKQAKQVSVGHEGDV